MEPQIHFAQSYINNWVGKRLDELYLEMEAVRLRIKEATDYRWDNSKFYVQDSKGHAALQLQFWPDCISAWDKNGRVVALDDQNNAVVSKKLVECVRTSICAIEKHMAQCAKCFKWVSAWKNFSFAGAVCLECYDPRVHRGPDTRGD